MAISKRGQEPEAPLCPQGLYVYIPENIEPCNSSLDPAALVWVVLHFLNEGDCGRPFLLDYHKDIILAKLHKENGACWHPVMNEGAFAETKEEESFSNGNSIHS